MKNKIIFGIIILGCIFLFFFQLTLVKQSDRTINHIELSKDLQDTIILETQNLSEIEIINYSVNKTSDLLEFSNVNNCITYSRMCASICNTAFQAHNIKSTAKCVVGYVKVYGINLCSLLSKINKKHKMFLKDHDFVEISNCDHIIYVDPTLQDLIGMDLKQINIHNNFVGLL